MRLSEELWLEGPYYIDYDRLGELRIAGPGNHLQYGSTGLSRKDLRVTAVGQDGGGVFVDCELAAGIDFMADPAMGHIRRVRDAVLHLSGGIRSFKQEAAKLTPGYVGLEVRDDGIQLEFKRFYGRHWYGVRIIFAAGVGVKRHSRRRGFVLERGPTPIALRLEPITDNLPTPEITRFFSSQKIPATRHRDQAMAATWDRSAIEITHMLKYGKTSGYDFGTIFPRDWMESADLGEGDLLLSAQAYMYSRSLQHVGVGGVGWHEDIVGEYLHEERSVIRQTRSELDELLAQAHGAKRRLDRLVARAQDAFVNRNMVDIEPHYLLGLNRLSRQLKGDDLLRLKRVAGYVMAQAEQHELITFKHIPDALRRHKDDRHYYPSGNWRDSDDAFQKIHPVVAPYDVNAVFYPEALKMVARHHKLLGVDKTKADLLAAKWAGAKERFRFTNPDGSTAFAIALYDVKQAKEDLLYRKLEVNHTDEAYDLYYGDPTEADSVSFARRLLDPNYFFTESGPLIVGRRQGYTTRQYHGEVIWLKQTAYAVAGLARQLDAGKSQGWSRQSLQLLHRAAKTLAQTSLDACRQLDLAPELYIDRGGKAGRYDLQPGVGWPMNQVQLWSAVGIRRIIREYIRLLGDAG